MAIYVSVLHELEQNATFKLERSARCFTIDWFVASTKTPFIQRKLLSKKKVTFDTALETSQALEAAMKNAQEMQDAIALTKEGKAEGPPAAGQVH